MYQEKINVHLFQNKDVTALRMTVEMHHDCFAVRNVHIYCKRLMLSFVCAEILW